MAAKQKDSAKLGRRRFLRLALSSTPLLLAADAFALEPEWIKVRTVRLGPAIPAHRFVQFSDLHHKGDCESGIDALANEQIQECQDWKSAKIISEAISSGRSSVHFRVERGGTTIAARHFMLAQMNRTAGGWFFA